ncbi:hypothetical protein, partial [Thiolapillus sp.]|uniref:hypothetical protein n=1 Tax=Thiolapillus sp. TaxID=2017437 RepID=UPI003AF7DE06
MKKTALGKTVWKLSKIALSTTADDGATMKLEEHYSQLLGINSPWEIYDVELKVDESRLDIWIEY